MLKRESIRDWMKAQIAHSLPGRLRLVVPGLEFIQGERQGLARDLAGIPGVNRVRITVPTSGVLLEYDSARMDASAMLEQANMVIQKYAMAVYRSRHAGRTEEKAELSMPVRTLGKRLAVNVGALTLGNFVFKTAPATGTLGKLTSVQALASLGLSLPIARSAMEICSPVESSTSISRVGGRLSNCFVNSVSLSVTPPGADTVIIKSCPALRKLSICFATCFTRSTVFTEVPPYFCTISAMLSSPV